MAPTYLRKIKHVVVIEDGMSPTGYTIIFDSGKGVPASMVEVRLWEMYQETVARVRHLSALLASQDRKAKGTRADANHLPLST